jgi:hypothetical protein
LRIITKRHYSISLGRTIRLRGPNAFRVSKVLELLFQKATIVPAFNTYVQEAYLVQCFIWLCHIIAFLDGMI